MRFISFLLAGHLLAGADLTIGVMGLYRPERLNVQPTTSMLRITAGDRTVVLEPGRVAGLHAFGNEIDLFAKGTQSSVYQVKVSGLDGKAVEFQLSVPGELTRKYTGTLSVQSVSGSLGAVVALNLELATGAALAAEMPGGTPAEALRAMAVLIRSYYAGSPRRHSGFDFCDTTHCQFHRSPAGAGTDAASAVAATKDLVLWYGGAPLPGMYSAQCGGRTRTGAQAGLQGGTYTYEAVSCAACIRGSESWTRELPASVAEVLLHAPTEANRLRIVRMLGWSALPSNNYDAHRVGERILIVGRGAGHGMGLCQQGAIGMAKAGFNFEFILKHYLPGVTLGPYTRKEL